MNNKEDSLPLAGCLSSHAESSLVFAGLPDDSQSSYRYGCAKAPQRIRSAYNGHCYNATAELGISVEGRVADLGDLAPKPDWTQTRQTYREFAETLFRDGKIPFFAGGDHAVTVPILEALAVLKHPIHVVQLDAHPDLYPEFEGNRYSHACTAARILEMDHVHKLVQLGLRTLNKPQLSLAQKERERLKMARSKDFSDFREYYRYTEAKAPVYITLDMDVFDPAYTPGVSHPVPGGLSSRDILNFIHNLPWRIVGMDVVEVNPDLDVNDQTSILAGRILHEAMARVLLQ
ncbi:agmatinase [candidate division KSB1 bacterium]|nr:agmatinase [candidate division KSB1 bacterium]